jgi:tRNA dimethylallyltransferase
MTARPEPVLLLLGPTATGKTELALELHARIPCELVSVDSAMVYRGMDIGTAKPGRAVLERVPHRLIDIRDPAEAYSAGDFRRDALQAIADIRRQGRMPVLVGGTMLYFHVLQHGLSTLPPADPAVRSEIDAEAGRRGWPALHAELAELDPATAARIETQDAQRIQRALEVYRVSGVPLSEWHRRRQPEPIGAPLIKVGTAALPRSELHARIARRFGLMMEQGFLDEVVALYGRGDLHAALPSMRAVGYRQLWAHLEGRCDLDEALEKAMVATRRLAKRQMTWIRSQRDLVAIDPLEPDATDRILDLVKSVQE